MCHETRSFVVWFVAWRIRTPMPISRGAMRNSTRRWAMASSLFLPLPANQISLADASFNYRILMRTGSVGRGIPERWATARLYAALAIRRDPYTRDTR